MQLFGEGRDDDTKMAQIKHYQDTFNKIAFEFPLIEKENMKFKHFEIFEQLNYRESNRDHSLKELTHAYKFIARANKDCKFRKSDFSGYDHY
jgi:hypothetical protein